MSGGELARLLRWYPPAWRERYSDELDAYLEDRFGPGRPPLRARLSLVAGGIRERCRCSGLTGDSVPPPDRVRAATLLVLGSWTAFVIAGSSFAKLSEHFDSALPNGMAAHHAADLAYTAVQTVAEVAALMVIAAAMLALPAFVRYVRSGGWSHIRRHTYRAAGCTVVTAAVTAPLIVWAHHLNDYQRNGGLVAYSLLFLVWAALVVGTLILWTVLAVAAARQVDFSRSLLIGEAGLAVAVAVTMVVILAATALWWAAMATNAPSFFSSDPSLPLNSRLVATVAFMTVAAAVATAGSIRILRLWPALRHN